MKLNLAAVVALTLSTTVNCFHLSQKGNIPNEGNIGKEHLATCRRSFFSAAAFIGSVGFLSPPQSANAASIRDGKQVDSFGKPIPLHESLSRESTVKIEPKAKTRSDDSKLLAEAKEREAKELEAKEEEERIELEKKELEEERLSIARAPPDVPRVLVLGGTGAVGKKVRSKLEGSSLFL